MKVFFPLLMLLMMLNVRAGDTLTRAQVYNFNVGDTFDYKVESQDGTLNDNPGITFDLISFQRIVIKQIQNFPAQDSFSVIEESYRTPNPSDPNDTFSFQSNDTLMMDSASNYAVLGSHNYCGYSLCSIIIDTGYNQRIINEGVSCGGLGCYTDNNSYADGLGMANSYSYGSDGFSSWSSTSYTLIYFSKGSEKWGVPATIAMGVNDVATFPSSIVLLPTINNGQFKISVSNGHANDYQLAIYDLTGREIKRAALNNSINDIEILSANTGMYLWNVTSQGAILQSGKMVIN